MIPLIQAKMTFYTYLQLQTLKNILKLQLLPLQHYMRLILTIILSFVSIDCGMFYNIMMRNFQAICN